MGICKKILVLYFLFLTNFLHAEASLEATKVSVFDLILVKYDIYFEKVKSRILTKTKKAIMVHYQTVEQDISFDEDDTGLISLSASDVDGDDLSYSITGGADITALLTGSDLNFSAPQDYNVSETFTVYRNYTFYIKLVYISLKINPVIHVKTAA